MAVVTPLKTAAEQELVRQYATAKAELPGGTEVRKLREDAFALVEAKGLPHRRLEAWRYTDLRALMREARPLAEAKVVGPAVAVRARELAEGTTAFVLVDGVFRPELSATDRPAGVTVESLAEALVSPRSDLGKVLSGPSIAEGDQGLALNTALMRDGVFVEIAADAEIAQPIAIVSLVSGEEERAVYHRSVVRIGDGAKATVLEVSESVGGRPNQVNGALVVEAGDRSEVQHVRLATRQPEGAVQVLSLLASVGGEAKLDSFALVCDAATTRQQHFVRYGSEHTEVGLRGVNLLRGQEHSDVTLVVDHAVPHGTSRELYKTIASDEAVGVFQGKVIVRPHAQKTDGGMRSNALLLNDGAVMYNKPELEIFADDVVCGHGATVAQIDDEQLFYLMARGLPRPQAEALVLQAFAGEAAEFVADEALRERVMAEVERWLAARGPAAA